MSVSDAAAIRPAQADDLAAIIAALKGLARDLGDPFHATAEVLHDALFGPGAHSRCLLAGAGPAPTPTGIVLFSPFVSTVLGQACVYVSDLWVDRAARGRALGKRLLAAAARDGARHWQARALYLNVYSHSTEALAFYRHVGFRFSDADNRGALKGEAFERLAEVPG